VVAALELTVEAITSQLAVLAVEPTVYISLVVGMAQAHRLIQAVAVVVHQELILGQQVERVALVLS
tara:strand:+ start:256 stop:453 length:198 start_codon:yes stop_codon:yes gene_type:complete